MISKNKIKLFNSLKIRKYRKKHSLFVAEGQKIIKDILKTGIKASYIASFTDVFNDNNLYKYEFIETNESDIKKISNLKTPTDSVAIFEMPTFEINYSNLKNELSIFCDNIQNPGNLGTIIRTADWFGIDNIFCTIDTVDVYNPKVIQASMGAIARVKIHYIKTENFFNEIDENLIVYGTFLEGNNIYKTNLNKNGIIVIGNEGSGISKEVEKFITKRIHIPNYSNNINKSESLNASIATAIVCAEFKRNF